MEELVRDLAAYLGYLHKTHGLQITLHEEAGLVLKYHAPLLPYNIHQNPYCLYVKSDYEVWLRCVERQHKVHKKAREGAFFGVCCAGVAEFVFPLFGVAEEYLGFLCVSGYRAAPDPPRLKAFFARHNINPEQAGEIYKNGLSPQLPEAGFLRVLIQPLISLYALINARTAALYASQGDAAEDANARFARILAYIDRHYAEPLNQEQVAAHFHCSPSYLSRLFSQKGNAGFCQTVTLRRIAAAKTLLSSTDFSVQEIAYTVGFTDPNYFSSLFKREAGLPPTQWRQQSKNGQKQLAHY